MVCSKSESDGLVSKVAGVGVAVHLIQIAHCSYMSSTYDVSPIQQERLYKAKL